MMSKNQVYVVGERGAEGDGGGVFDRARPNGK